VLQDAALAGACFAAIQLAAGEADTAYRLLPPGSADPKSLDAELGVWLATLAAETAEALGRDDEAARHYAAAFAASGAAPSIYLLTVHADFLLRRGQPAAVVESLERAPPADSILLRLALAERRTGHDAAERVEILRYRLALALDGADVAHAREAAFFALYLDDDPERALALAQANWGVQREPIDARLVREAEQRAPR
jgi:hypothetical protein